MDASVVDEETKMLVKEIQRLGRKMGDGKYTYVSYDS